MNARCLTVILVLATAVSCSSVPTAPTNVPSNQLSSDDGSAGTASVTTERLRLRRVGDGDIVTNLVDGQTIDVPVNTNLDIWAEVRRLEGDRARLVVNWGNGNADFSGCGACRLENTYTEPGRYTVTAGVLDLNAPSGTPPVTSVTVTLVVAGKPPECDPVTVDFESFPFLAQPPFSSPGATLTGGGTVFITGGDPYAPEMAGHFLRPNGSLTVAFDSDKTSFSLGFGSFFTTTGTTYMAVNAQGVTVASGIAFATIPASGNLKGTLSFSASKFRRVILTQFSFGYDNIRATCE